MPSVRIKPPGPARRALGWTILTVVIALPIGVLAILVLAFVYNTPEERAAHPVITYLMAWVAILLIFGSTVLTIAAVAGAFVSGWRSDRRSVVVPGTVAQFFEDYGRKGIVYRSIRVVLAEDAGDREVTVVTPRRHTVGDAVEVRVDPLKPTRVGLVDRSFSGIVGGAFMELLFACLIVGAIVGVGSAAVSVVRQLF